MIQSVGLDFNKGLNVYIHTALLISFNFKNHSRWFLTVGSSDLVAGEFWLQTGNAIGNQFIDESSALRVGFQRGSNNPDGMWVFKIYMMAWNLYRSASFITGDDAWQNQNPNWLIFNNPYNRNTQPIFMYSDNICEYRFVFFKLPPKNISSVSQNRAGEDINRITFIENLRTPQAVTCEYKDDSQCTGWYGMK